MAPARPLSENTYTHFVTLTGLNCIKRVSDDTISFGIDCVEIPEESQQILRDVLTDGFGIAVDEHDPIYRKIYDTKLRAVIMAHVKHGC